MVGGSLQASSACGVQSSVGRLGDNPAPQADSDGSHHGTVLQENALGWAQILGAVTDAAESMETAKKIWWKTKQLALALTGGYHHSGERVCPVYPDGNFRSHMEVYRFVAQFVKAKRVLDVGCGTGYGDYHLLMQGAKSVHGVDASAEAIAYARRAYRDSRLEFLVMDAHELAYRDNSFDVVVSSENLEHLRNPQKNLSEIRRVLKERGLLILGTPNKEIASPGMPSSSNPFHVNEYTYESLEDMMRDHFGSVNIFENTETSPSRLGRSMKEERKRVGRVGIELGDRRSIQIGTLTVDLTHLRNTHSFMVIAW